MLKTSYRLKTIECYKLLQLPQVKNQPGVDSDHDHDPEDGAYTDDNDNDVGDNTNHKPNEPEQHQQHFPTIPPETTVPPDNPIKEIPTSSGNDFVLQTVVIARLDCFSLYPLYC